MDVPCQHQQAICKMSDCFVTFLKSHSKISLILLPPSTFVVDIAWRFFWPSLVGDIGHRTEANFVVSRRRGSITNIASTIFLASCRR